MRSRNAEGFPNNRLLIEMLLDDKNNLCETATVYLIREKKIFQILQTRISY